MNLVYTVIAVLNWIGAFLPQLGLRFILAYEFWKAGLNKYHNPDNVIAWFGQLKDSFPFPFSAIPPEINYYLATGFELAGAVALAIGLATRFFATSLLILTVVAILSAHMPHPDVWNGNLLKLWELGYHHKQMLNGNFGFEIPLLYFLMLLPLIFNGPGVLSVDYLFSFWLKPKDDMPR